MSRPKNLPNKRSLLAVTDLDRLGCNPIERLVELAEMNVKAFKEFRGYGEKGDAGVGYLSNATRIYIELAKFKHPTLSAIAVKDMTDDSETKQPMTTKQAIQTLAADPFAPQALKDIANEDVIDAMSSKIDKPFLPSGNKDE